MKQCGRCEDELADEARFFPVAGRPWRRRARMSPKDRRRFKRKDLCTHHPGTLGNAPAGPNRVEKG